MVVGVIGIGADILLVERFRRSLARFGRGYLDDVFSDEELARALVPAYLTEAAFYARAFCAKEACAKALGTGIDETVYWYDFSVDQSTLPATISLSNGALARVAELTPIGCYPVISLDVGSREGLAQANVMISAIRDIEQRPVS